MSTSWAPTAAAVIAVGGPAVGSRRRRERERERGWNLWWRIFKINIDHVICWGWAQRTCNRKKKLTLWPLDNKFTNHNHGIHHLDNNSSSNNNNNNLDTTLMATTNEDSRSKRGQKWVGTFFQQQQPSPQPSPPPPIHNKKRQCGWKLAQTMCLALFGP